MFLLQLGLIIFFAYLDVREDLPLVLDVLDLLESDDVVDGEDLEGEVVAAVPLPAQTHAGERACKQKLYKSVDFL